MMPTEVQRASDQLLQALRDTETFQTYAALKQAVMADEVNRRLLSRFTQAQTALQMAAMVCAEPREEDTREFERLSALLYESEDVTEYLLAQMRVQQLVAAVLEKITSEAGISVEMKES